MSFRGVDQLFCGIGIRAGGLQLEKTFKSWHSQRDRVRLTEVGDSELVIGFRVHRIDVDRFLERFHGLLGFATIGQDCAQIVETLPPHGRIQLSGLLSSLGCFIDFAGIGKSEAHIAEIGRLVSFQLDGFAIGGCRIIVFLGNVCGRRRGTHSGRRGCCAGERQSQISEDHVLFGIFFGCQCELFAGFLVVLGFHCGLAGIKGSLGFRGRLAFCFGCGAVGAASAPPAPPAWCSGCWGGCGWGRGRSFTQIEVDARIGAVADVYVVADRFAFDHRGSAIHHDGHLVFTVIEPAKGIVPIPIRPGFVA